MKKKYLIKYKYKKVRMSFMFYADNELDALKQFETKEDEVVYE